MKRLFKKINHDSPKRLIETVWVYTALPSLSNSVLHYCSAGTGEKIAIFGWKSSTVIQMPDAVAVLLKEFQAKLINDTIQDFNCRGSFFLRCYNAKARHCSITLVLSVGTEDQLLCCNLNWQSINSIVLKQQKVTRAKRKRKINSALGLSLSGWRVWSTRASDNHYKL